MSRKIEVLVLSSSTETSNEPEALLITVDQHVDLEIQRKKAKFEALRKGLRGEMCFYIGPQEIERAVSLAADLAEEATEDAAEVVAA